MENSKTPQPDDEKNRAKIARKAQVEGYIPIVELPGMMAADESYNNILPFLREQFAPRFFIGSSKYNLSTHQGRFQTWMNIIRRWAGLEADPTKKKLPSIDYLNCYSKNKITGKFILIARDKTKPEYLDDYIALDDLAEYLKNTEHIYQTKLPFPVLLYPDNDKEITKQDIPFADNYNETSEEDPEYFPIEVIDLMNKVRPEIESVYEAVKEGGGFNNLGEVYDDARMEAALNYFEEYEDKFIIIKKGDLQNKKIFKTSTSQHSRTVKGRLLQTIVERHGLGGRPFTKLFKEYQKQKKIITS